jgi:hypothetical protein
MQGSVRGMCDAHPFDRADGCCTMCRRSFCEDCLVDPHLVTKEIFCIRCAVSAAGVRSSSKRTPRAAASTGRAAMGVLMLTGIAGAAASAAILFI